MLAGVDDLIARYASQPVPRYTSYPTAAQFTSEVGPALSRQWLASLPAGEPISLYLHVPFCHELCLFCGCNTSVARAEVVRAAYGALLLEELQRVRDMLGDARRTITHLQWGGGTPTSLPASTFRRIMHTVRQLFVLAHDAELSIEVDPRHFPDAYPQLLRGEGFTRVSLGVQDLDERVQQACGRHQSHEQTAHCIERIREAGIEAVNIDLIYGLPKQTVDSVERTARDVAQLGPDRLAVFGYAHVPWKQKRQSVLDSTCLPDMAERFAQRAAIDEVLATSGYRRIGLDHYARPTDTLSIAADAGRMHRNFQGYTLDTSQCLIGVGATAISVFAQGMVQNAPSAATYAQKMAENRYLPVARGVVRTFDDTARGRIIERLMCDLAVNIERESGLDWQALTTEHAALGPFVDDGLATLDGPILQVTETGRPFLRSIAAVFDQYTDGRPQRHAAAL